MVKLITLVVALCLSVTLVAAANFQTFCTAQGQQGGSCNQMTDPIELGTTQTFQMRVTGLGVAGDAVWINAVANTDYSVQPTFLNFTGTGGQAFLQFSVTAKAVNAAAAITWNTDSTSPDATYYPASYPVTKSLIKRSIKPATPSQAVLSGSTTLVVGVPSNSFAITLSTPSQNGVTFTFQSNSAVVATPSTLTFSPTTSVINFNLQSNVNGPVSVAFVPTGGVDQALYSDTYNFTIQVNKRNFIVSPFYNALTSKVNVQSQVARITTDYAPPTGVTLTPYAEFTAFTPSSLTFGPGTDSQQFTFVSSKVGSHEVAWYISGADAALYNNLGNTTLVATALTFLVTSPAKTSYIVGQTTDTYTVYTENAPRNDVTITISASTCANGVAQILPSNVLTFSPTVFSQTFQVKSSVKCAVSFTTVLSGTNKDDFGVAAITPVVFDVIKVTANAAQGSIGCGDKTVVTLTANNPSLSLNGYTVSMIAPNAVLSPNSIQFTNGNGATQIATFTATSSNQNSFTITYTVTGPDSNLVGSISSTTVTVNPKTIAVPTSVNTLGSTSFLAGTVSDLNRVRLNKAPTTKVTVQLSAPGLTLTPSTLDFLPNQLDNYFTVSGGQAGSSYTISYTLDGTSPDAGCYTTPVSTTPVSVSLLAIQVTPAFQSNLALGVQSQVYTLDIPNLATAVTVTPQIVDLNGNVNPAVVFNPATLPLTPATPSASFTYTSSSLLTNSVYQLKYTVTPGGLVDTSLVTAPTFVQRTFTLPASLSSAGGFYRAQSFFAGVPSSPQLIKLDDYPTAPVTLTPYAPNTVFTPATLTFDTTTKTQSFTITTLDGVDGGISKAITFTVSDTVNFVAPSASFMAVLRQLKVSNLAALTGSLDAKYHVNTPIPFTVATLQAPSGAAGSGPVVVTPSGGFFTFSPASITLDASTTAATFTATPTNIGSSSFYVTVTGAEGNYYAPIAPVSITTVKSTFQVDQPSSNVLTIGSPSQVFRIRPQALPSAAGVTVTVSSPQVTVAPNTFTFTSTSGPQTFTITPNANYFTTYNTGFSDQAEFIFDVSGADQKFFSVPVLNYAFTVSNPMRTLTLSTNSLDIQLGGSSILKVSSNIPPATAAGVTITPFIKDPSFQVTPASLTFTPTSYSGVFTITRNSYSTGATLYFVLSGADAAFYVSPATVTLSATSGILSLNNLLPTVVNTPSNGLYLSLSKVFNVPLVVTPTVLSGAAFTFTPAQITIAAGQAGAYFTATANAVGSYTVGFSLGGDGAGYVDTPAPITGNVGPATVAFPWLNSLSFSTGESTTDYAVTLSTPTVGGLTITPSAVGFTFRPATITFAAGASSAAVTVTATANLAKGPLTYVYGGVDALLYNNPCQQLADCTAATNEGTVSASVKTNPSTPSLHAVFNVEVSTLPVSSLTVTPTAAGVTFIPSSWTFSNVGASTYNFDAVANTATGVLTVPTTYTITGPSAAFYRKTSNTPVQLTFAGNSISTSTPGNVPVGQVSAPITVTLAGPVNGASPIPPAYIIPVADRPGVTFYPANISLDAATATNGATFAVKGTFIGSTVVRFPVSGAGASYYISNSAAYTTTVNFVQSTFDFGSINNMFALVNGGAKTFVFGVTSQQYTVYCRSAPVAVTLGLYSANFDFQPNQLKFDNTTQAVTFTMTGKKIGPAVINFNIISTNPELFAQPAALTAFYVTYDVQVDQIPILHIGQMSDPINVRINPAPQASFAVTMSGGTHVYSPSTLVFTPNALQQSFTILPMSSTVAQPSGVNIPGTATSYVNSGAAAYLSFTGRDASDTAVSTGVTQAVQVSLIVAPGTFTVHHPRYQMDVKTTVKVSVSAAPRADVTLSMWGNNMLYDPPFVTFRAGGPTEQEISATPLHASSYDVDYAPFKVDYALSGTNVADYAPPSESFHYIALSQGYLAAVILAPIAFLAIIVALVIFVFARGGGSSSRSVGAHA